ncbi:MAG: hypothetical protein KDC92_16225, partial [Bacteroidetes bacterium]|nr:hypothetical protein [Bacteroidota bacterium]
GFTVLLKAGFDFIKYPDYKVRITPVNFENTFTNSLDVEGGLSAHFTFGFTLGWYFNFSKKSQEEID